jgi:hypothetical protein
MPENHKAFVISPIGDPNSQQREHADWVLKSIIRPACELAKSEDLVVYGHRSDHEAMPGDIMDQVIAAIMHDRIVFAVLAYDRPNVYYELALAHAAGRHVIVLQDQDEEKHFDVAGKRAISYRYRMDGPELEKKIKEVADTVSAVLAEKEFQPAVFKNLNPLGRLSHEYEFKPAFRDIDVPSYYDIFDEAREFIGLQGISLWHFARLDFYWNVKVRDRKNPKAERRNANMRFFDIVQAKLLFDAVNVRIVMMHEDNTALAHLIKFADRESYTQSIATTRDEIKRSFEAWSKLKLNVDAKASERDDGRKGKLEIVQLRQSVVNYRLTATDQLIVLSPYFNVFPFNSQGPALIARKDTPFYECVIREFIDRAVANEMALAALADHGNLETG